MPLRAFPEAAASFAYLGFAGRSRVMGAPRGLSRSKAAFESFRDTSSCEIGRNPSLKSDRDRGRRPTTLQGEVAGPDQMAAPRGR